MFISQVVNVLVIAAAFLETVSVHLYTVSQKTSHFVIAHIFVKY